MIRNAVLHLNNEQPLVADLYDLPASTDLGLRCTNLRMLNGKRPIFADDSQSMFFFPYLHIRFIEIPPAALGGEVPVPAGVAASLEAPAAGADEALDEADLEIDEDFLRRIREV